jgi:glycerol-3-phosphate cytidylyltransferase-like family protein
MTMAERIRAVKASGLVDRVIGNAPLVETDRFYQIYGIDKTAHAHSVEQHESYRKQFFPEAGGDKLVRLNYTPGVSTTELLDRILSRFSSDEVVHK